MKDIDQFSALGRYVGTMDGMIVYLYRGRRYIRRKPSKVKSPSAPGQVAQQGRMASIAIFYQALKEVGIYAFWQQAAEGMVQNGYNLLVKYNLPAFNRGGVICDFSKLRLTMGTVALPDGLRMKGGSKGAEDEEGRESGERAWRLEWEETPDLVNASPDDRMLLYVMKDYRTFAVKPLECGDTRRRDGGVTFRVPKELGEYGHLYVVFLSGDGGKCSDSKYFNMNKNNNLNNNSYGTL